MALCSEILERHAFVAYIGMTTPGNANIAVREQQGVLYTFRTNSPQPSNSKIQFAAIEALNDPGWMDANAAEFDSRGLHPQRFHDRR